MSDYSELKRLAEAATGGDWEYRLGMIRTFPYSDGYVPIAVAPNAPKNWRGQRDANMGFIAAANPAIILALVAENERLHYAIKHNEACFHLELGESERLRKENEALRKQIDDMSPLKGAPLTGPDFKCLACGGYHYGMSGLPCPKMAPMAQGAVDD